MLDYMYLGSVEIRQDRVERFMSFVSQMGVKGLNCELQNETEEFYKTIRVEIN